MLFLYASNSWHVGWRLLCDRTHQMEKIETPGMVPFLKFQADSMSFSRDMRL